MLARLVPGVCDHVHLQNLLPLEGLLTDRADERVAVGMLGDVQPQLTVAAKLCAAELAAEGPSLGAMDVQVCHHLGLRLHLGMTHAADEAVVPPLVQVPQQLGHLLEHLRASWAPEQDGLRVHQLVLLDVLQTPQNHAALTTVF